MMNNLAPVPLPTTYQEVAARLVNRPIFENVKFLNRRMFDHTGSHPDILDFAGAMSKECEKRGIPMFVHTAFRGRREQEKVHDLGHSKARFGQSPHNFGMAVDIVHYARFWELTRKEWAVIGLIGKEVARRRNIKIVWGGDWKFYDPAHWELAEWRNLKAKAQ